MLGATEIYLILRARNEAGIAVKALSRDFENLDKQAKKQATANIERGKALVGLGAGMALAGGVAINAFNKMTNEAVKYNQQVSLTSTQVDKAKVSFKDLSDMGLRIAKTVPVAFDDIQKSLYDIFSSMDVNGPDAEKILKAIAQAAVGGATDMATAGRALIGVLNAYKLPATQVTHVSDVMFQLVRKGVGTYEQFTSVIGRAVPSAIRANQSFEQLAGMMAFLTRNGLSTAMAAASAGRALDALSNPKTAEHFKDIGISIYDIHGKIRPVVDIMEDLRKKIGKLSTKEQTEILYNLFKGSGGTIQAMRFFNHAVHDTNGLLVEMTSDMYHANGAAAQAYKVMSNTPQAKVELLKNRYKAMRIELGENLIPVKMALVNVLNNILNAFNKLSPTMKKWITYILLGVAVVTLLVGAIIAVAGAIMILETVGAPVILIILAIIAAIAALVAIAVLLYKNWGPISAFVTRIWNDVYKAVSHAVDNVIHAWDNVSNATTTAWHDVYMAVSTAVNAVVQAITHAWDNVVHAFDNVMHALDNLLHAWDNFWHAMVNTWNVVEPIIRDIFLVFYAVFGTLIRLQIEAFQKLWSYMWSFAVATWNTVGKPIFDAVAAAVRTMWGIVKLIFQALQSTWKQVWSGVVATWNAAKWIFGQIESFIRTLGSIASNAWKGMKKDWDNTWGAMKATWDKTGKPVFNAVGAAAKYLKDKVLAPIWSGIKTAWSALWNGLGKSFSSAWDTISTLVRNAINGLIGVLNAFIGFINGLLGKLPGHFHINTIPKIGAPRGPARLSGTASGNTTRGFALGGVLPGYSPGFDNLMLPYAMFSGGEGILVPEAVRALGGARGIHSINSMFSSRVSGGGHFAGGGIFGAIGGVLKKSAQVALDEVRKGVAAALRAGLNLAEKPVKSAIGLLPEGIVQGVASGAFTQIDKAVRSLIDDVGGKARKKAAADAAKAATSGNFPGGGADGNVVKLALAMAKKMHASRFVAEALIEAGIVESGLRNLSYGDRDSLGFLQQRPSQGWLHPNDISYAAWDFLRRAIPIAGGYGSPGRLAQAVQVSAFPDRYDAAAGSANAILNANGWRSGAWKIPSTQYGPVHAGEMILPSDIGEGVRQYLGGRGGAPTQNFYIYTNEIDPRVHAAQLGFELNSKVAP